MEQGTSILYASFSGLTVKTLIWVISPELALISGMAILL
jgi:hypothetical protein